MVTRAGVTARVDRLVERDLARAERAAEELGVQLIFEGFADRAYDKSGALVARTQPHAVHNNIDTIVAQSLCFARKQPVPTSNGQSLMLKADSLCVHGDSPIALESVRAIYDALR